jgi:hypothetical protein
LLTGLEFLDEALLSTILKLRAREPGPPDELNTI